MNDLNVLAKPAVVVTVREVSSTTKPQPTINAPRFDFEAGSFISPKLVLCLMLVAMTVMVVAFAVTYRGGLDWNHAEAIRSLKAIL